MSQPRSNLWRSPVSISEDDSAVDLLSQDYKRLRLRRKRNATLFQKERISWLETAFQDILTLKENKND